MTLTIPDRLASACRAGDAAAWLEQLPTVVAEAARRWGLTVGHPFADASCAWVAPATLASGRSVVLKIGLPHFEAAHEALGLRAWLGGGAVRLLDADESLNALLLEACFPGHSLRALAETEQDVVISQLLGTMRRCGNETMRRCGAATGGGRRESFRHLSAMLDMWAAETVAKADEWADVALVRVGLELFHELSQPTENDVLLHTDLHAGNVLSANRMPWLVIDPKPFIGDPAYDGTQHLLNCRGRLRASPSTTISRFADLLEVSRERLRLWTFARAAAEPRADWRNDPLQHIARALAP